MASMPRDPEWAHLTELHPQSFARAKAQIVEEAENVAHLDGTGTIGRLLAVIYAMERAATREHLEHQLARGARAEALRGAAEELFPEVQEARDPEELDDSQFFAMRHAQWLRSEADDAAPAG